MRILLTGGSGMVGRNILEHSAAADYEFLTPSSRQLDLLDEQSVDRYIHEHHPDMILHAAGVVGGIQANIAQPVQFLVENLQIGLNLVMSARKNRVPRLLNLGSSCMFPRNAPNPLAEDSILQGELEPTNEGYALAKITISRLCEYIHKQDPVLKYKTAIPCNLFGRYDKFDLKNSHMIPAVIKRIHDAKQKNHLSIDIWGDGLARREFMYAGDMADFIFYAVPRFDEMPDNINVGLGHDYTINEYYSAITGVIGYTGEFNHDLTKPVGMQRKLIDNTKLKNFGWQPTTSLADGIRLTYQFYLDNHS